MKQRLRMALAFCAVSACTNPYDSAALNIGGGLVDTPLDSPFSIDVPDGGPSNMCPGTEGVTTYSYRRGFREGAEPFEATLMEVESASGGSRLHFAESGVTINSHLATDAWQGWLGHMLRVSDVEDGTELVLVDGGGFVAFVGGWLLNAQTLNAQRSIDGINVTHAEGCVASVSHRSGPGSCPRVQMRFHDVSIDGRVLPRGESIEMSDHIIHHSGVGQRIDGESPQCADAWTPLYGVEVVRRNRL